MNVVAAQDDSLDDPASNVMSDEELRAAMAEAFDAKFYGDRYADVTRAGADPLEHYLAHGWRENRNPFRELEGAYYRKKYLGDAPPDMSPLAHYVLEGRALGLPLNRKEELRRFGDRDWSALVLQVLQASGMDLDHVDGSLFHRFILPLFSADAHRRRRGIIATLSDTQLLAQYLAFDLPEGVPPGPLFDSDWYGLQAQKAGLPPVDGRRGTFLHWLEHGVAARIVPNALFDEATYLACNPDVAEQFEGWAFEHFLICGLSEERRFSPLVYLEPNRTRALSPGGRSRNETFLTWAAGLPAGADEFAGMAAFLKSDRIADILDRATALEPQIGRSRGGRFQLLPPWQDADYADFRAIRDLIPLQRAKRIILMPFCKMGGADFVAGVLAGALPSPDETLILRTEQSDWARPDWFPKGITSIDLSAHLNLLEPDRRRRILYELIRGLGARHVYNVNSRLGFETFETYGARLARFTRLYAHYFCSDWTPDGCETGYPVLYFATVLPHLQAALFDNAALPARLTSRFALPAGQLRKLQVLYVPVLHPPPETPLVHRQVESKSGRDRPVLLWAGRLDRQKRFDLVIEIARAMPDIQIHCWGRAVLDAPMDDSVELPDNLVLNPAFERFDELPLRNSDGWLYTAAWDGLPNVLVEAGANGLPVVASAVDGIPELLDEDTGWPVTDTDDVQAYVNAIRAMLGDDAERIARAERLYRRVIDRHAGKLYRARLAEVEEAENG